MRRYLGASLIVAGVLILTVNVGELDRVVAAVTYSHGVHLSDLVGAAVVAVGAAILWRR